MIVEEFSCPNCNYKITKYKDDVSRTIGYKKRYEVLKRQGWKCNSCATKLKYNKESKWEGEVAHIDHIFPYSLRENYPKGIEKINELQNLQGLCPDCNLKKGGKQSE